MTNQQVQCGITHTGKPGLFTRNWLVVSLTDRPWPRTREEAADVVDRLGFTLDNQWCTETYARLISTEDIL